MDFSDDQLKGEDAIDELVERLENYVVAFKEDEVKSPFRAGSRIGGPMSRQPNEPMKLHMTRRQKGMIRVKSLDENTVSDNISKDEKRLTQTVCMNMNDFEMIATASRKQHADIHKRESRSKHEEDRPRAY